MGIILLSWCRVDVIDRRRCVLFCGSFLWWIGSSCWRLWILPFIRGWEVGLPICLLLRTIASAGIPANICRRGILITRGCSLCRLSAVSPLASLDCPCLIKAEGWWNFYLSFWWYCWSLPSYLCNWDPWAWWIPWMCWWRQSWCTWSSQFYLFCGITSCDNLQYHHRYSDGNPCSIHPPTEKEFSICTKSVVREMASWTCLPSLRSSYLFLFYY